MLGPQAVQAMTEEARSQALQQGHLGQGQKLGGQIGIVLRHADSKGVRLSGNGRRIYSWYPANCLQVINLSDEPKV
ncbi:mitogen-activated protein kinase 1 [Pseudomonas sp. St29]|nr:mitogen-activated protein kinase 1 [Pseudomonas sp. St29]